MMYTQIGTKVMFEPGDFVMCTSSDLDSIKIGQIRELISELEEIIKIGNKDE